MGSLFPSENVFFFSRVDILYHWQRFTNSLGTGDSTRAQRRLHAEEREPFRVVACMPNSELTLVQTHTKDRPELSHVNVLQEFSVSWVQNQNSEIRTVSDQKDLMITRIGHVMRHTISAVYLARDFPHFFPSIYGCGPDNVLLPVGQDYQPVRCRDIRQTKHFVGHARFEFPQTAPFFTFQLPDRVPVFQIYKEEVVILAFVHRTRGMTRVAENNAILLTRGIDQPDHMTFRARYSNPFLALDDHRLQAHAFLVALFAQWLQCACFHPALISQLEEVKLSNQILLFFLFFPFFPPQHNMVRSDHGKARKLPRDQFSVVRWYSRQTNPAMDLKWENDVLIYLRICVSLARRKPAETYVSKLIQTKCVALTKCKLESWPKKDQSTSLPPSPSTTRGGGNKSEVG